MRTAWNKPAKSRKVLLKDEFIFGLRFGWGTPGAGAADSYAFATPINMIPGNTLDQNMFENISNSCGDTSQTKLKNTMAPTWHLATSAAKRCVWGQLPGCCF